MEGIEESCKDEGVQCDDDTWQSGMSSDEEA